MSLYQKLKSIKWINYYILGEPNNNWYETFRNPFIGVGQLMGTKNINAHSIIDFRCFYVPYEKVPKILKYKYKFMIEKTPYYEIPNGVKKTLGEPWFRKMKNDMVIFELRKSHPIDAIYYNGGITFSFNLTNTYFPWFSLTIRWSNKHYFNCGIGWKGTNESDRNIARFGMKFRIANYDNEVLWNNSSVAPNFYEGHI